MTTTASSDPATVGLDPAALQRLVAAIQADIDQGQTAGAAIIVARGGAIGCREVLGHVAPGRAAAADDIYLLMSLSKSFAASLVLRAVDHGRFTLDTHAADVLRNSVSLARKASPSGSFSAIRRAYSPHCRPRLRWGWTTWGTSPRS